MAAQTANDHRPQPIDLESLVYIECIKSDEPKRQTFGSGVIISRSGHILTAKHVAPSRHFQCRGVLGTSGQMPVRYLIHRLDHDSFDVKILQFVPNRAESFKPVQFVKLEPDMHGMDILAYGFPRSGVGQPTIRKGIISTFLPDFNGHIETDTLTASGMSGGPVVLETGELIGIVAGVDIDPPTGLPTSYKVLAAQEFAHRFSELQESKLKSVAAISGTSGTGVPSAAVTKNLVGRNQISA